MRRSALKKYLRTLLVLPYRLLLRIWWPALSFLRSDSLRKRVLVCAVSDFMIDHLAPVVELIRNDTRVDIWLVCPTAVKLSGTTPEKLSRKIGLPIVNYALARFRWWDLILYAEHLGVDQFHPAIAKLLVQHGFDSGKLFDGIDIRYSREMMYKRRRSHTPRYASMFEPSVVTRDKAVQADPKLADRIAVVGDLGADRMQALVRRRDELLAEAGYAPDDFVVFVMGTWQEDSLMESIGPPIVAEAESLLSKYRFVFSTHPRHWRGIGSKSQPWGKFLLEHERPRLAVLRPDDSWERAAVISDMAITDHSSVSVKYALLGKPMVYIERREGIVSPGTFGARLYDALPRLKSPSLLESVIEQVRHEYPYREHLKIASEINACPGEAVVRIRQELYRLLNLPVPVA